MHCFKTEETLFEGAVPFHAKTSPTAQYSLSSMTYAGIGRHIINT